MKVGLCGSSGRARARSSEGLEFESRLGHVMIGEGLVDQGVENGSLF